ncbi:uncharacterized protein LOC111242711 [Vigna radiata var. radiata]|uniref:Uncharacterized protein LOC111242711 n=1 Tax=Vigna radiata var. radiata TaxID=3916 RepID=A0A3Q0FLF4_VIGRR|nr:uncharacterized protein LOC111242711 [Vigna radiata var. radiata]
MESGVTLDDYGASMAEMSQPFVRASFNPDGEEERKKAHSKSATNKKLKKDIDDGLDGVLEEQEVEIKALEEELEALKTELLEEKNKYYGGYSTPSNQHENCNNLGREGEDCNNETVMKHYMCRKRFKSAVCKTPYIGYSPKL